MLKYVLTSEKARKAVDLRDYDDIISDAILNTIQDDEPLVSIASDYIQIETDAPVTDYEWVKIDTILSSTELGRYQENNQMLFTPIEDENR